MQCVDDSAHVHGLLRGSQWVHPAVQLIIHTVLTLIPVTFSHLGISAHGVSPLGFFLQLGMQRVNSHPSFEIHPF